MPFLPPCWQSHRFAIAPQSDRRSQKYRRERQTSPHAWTTQQLKEPDVRQWFRNQVPRNACDSFWCSAKAILQQVAEIRSVERNFFHETGRQQRHTAVSARPVHM